MFGRIAGVLCFSLFIATAPVHAEDKAPVDPRLAAIVEQLKMAVTPCWLAPDTSKTPPLVVTVKIQLAKDGSIIGQPKVLTPKKTKAYDLIAKNAVRAIMRCAPFKTIPENADLYDKLKDVNINFHSPEK